MANLMLLTEVLASMSRSTVSAGTQPPIAIAQHADAAVEWIQEAFRQSPEGGISKGYDLLRDRWTPAYPETTGYTIPTLLNIAAVHERPELKALAFDLAEYLLKCSTPEGGVAHWAASDPYPIVFDTGQVMFGWLAAFEASQDERYLDAAKRAGDWLAAVQDESGSWQKHQHLDVEKVIDTRVDWALLRLFRHTDAAVYLETARRNLEWAQRQQDSDGWFNKCSFTSTEDPFTHTLAYTAEGLFECGQLMDETRFTDSARLTSESLLARQYPDGHLASTYGPGWQETSQSSCLTGNCQMARLWLRFYELEGKQAYYDAAQRAIAYVAGTQNLVTDNLAVRGAIAGSRPLYGKYERLKYPNWAAKFFIDALLTLQQVNEKDRLLYVG